MTSKYMLAFSALLLCACQSNSSLSTSLTKAQIESCWKQAGLQGDIYKFMSPDEVRGLVKVAGASNDQVQQFKACTSA